MVDFDAVVEPYTGVTPLIGPMITQMTEEILRSPAPHLGYDIILPSVFDNDPLQVREAVYHQKAWAAIVINPNATTLLQHAVEQGNTSYDPLGACQVIYVAARDQETLYSYILPQLSSLQSEAISAFGKMWTGMVLQNSSIPRTNLQRVPQALSPAIGFSQFDLRPFSPAVTTPAVSIGLIYLIIISFFSFLFYFPIHMRFLSPQGHPPLKFWQFIAWRWFANIAAYFFMSLAYSLISLAFQIPFANPSAPATAVATNPNAYGKGTFVVYWMINFVGMISLGLACENVTMVIGQPWTAMWLIFWVITNVATSFYAIDLAPRFYYWGYAWPLHNSKSLVSQKLALKTNITFPIVVEASRSTLFDLHSRIGLNLGILFVWCAINTALFPFCCYILKRKGERQRKAAMQEKK